MLSIKFRVPENMPLTHVSAHFYDPTSMAEAHDDQEVRQAMDGSAVIGPQLELHIPPPQRPLETLKFAVIGYQGGTPTCCKVIQASQVPLSETLSLVRMPREKENSPLTPRLSDARDEDSLL